MDLVLCPKHFTKAMSSVCWEEDENTRRSRQKIGVEPGQKLWTLEPWALKPWTLKPWTLMPWTLNGDLLD